MQEAKSKGLPECPKTNSSTVTSAIRYINDLFKDNADGHDRDHSLRVYHNAMNLSNSYPKCDRMIVALAALLHDADDHKLFHTENNANARSFLGGQGLDEIMIEQIIMIINEVSFSKNRGKKPGSIEGMIVQDADRLDALGAVGIARTFAYGGKNGRAMEESIQHFHDKLLLLRDEMNTPEARETADKRHAFLEAFLNEWNEETAG